MFVEGQRYLRRDAGRCSTGREIADPAIDHAEERSDGGLVRGDAIEITDVDGPPLVRMLADF